MKRDDIYDRVRKADFNRTEPETLSQLVGSAIKIGDEIKEDYVLRRQLTNEVLELLRKRELIVEQTITRETLAPLLTKLVSASDGSFQSVGAADGIWYVPVSAALVVFRQGFRSSPEIKVGAYVQRIDEREHQNVGGAMETSMLTAEANIMREWARDCPNGITHFLDGPVIDPPRQMDKQYLTYRIGTLQALLDKDILVLGCVKKLLGNFLIDHLKGILRDIEMNRIKKFGSDGRLIYHVFTKASIDTAKTVYTKPLEIGSNDITYKPYRESGIRVYFMYFQREPGTIPFRVDIPIKNGTKEGDARLGEEVAAALTAWSYPGYDLPVPIVIAHDKCNIRRGCAEVLYSEIITRAASNDMFDNLVRTKLGTEVF